MRNQLNGPSAAESHVLHTDFKRAIHATRKSRHRDVGNRELVVEEQVEDARFVLVGSSGIDLREVQRHIIVPHRDF